MRLRACLRQCQAGCECVRGQAGMSRPHKPCHLPTAGSLQSDTRASSKRQRTWPTCHLKKLSPRADRVSSHVLGPHVKIRWRLQSTRRERISQRVKECQDRCVRRLSDCPTGAAALRVRAAGSRSRQLVLRQQHRAQQRTRSGHDYVRERVRFT